LAAGEGFFVPAGHPYTYEAGPDGVEVLEFRHATTFNMRILDREETQWAAIFDVAISQQEVWSEMRAARVGAVPRP
jgi:hypothetical protein